ncbi:MAG: biotin/lipoyl-binding protein, partial [Bdellovibrionales bacterium]|nr:biotin/lipoyl-binding protein [Bdellovibrionales bacterium]
MSATVIGKLGAHDIEWLSIPRGPAGSGRVRVGNAVLDVQWRKDSHGIWLELPHGTFGFDLIAERDDDGRVLYRLKSRKSDEIHAGLHFTRAGEATISGGASQKKKSVRIRAQMPGKIIRLNVKSGDTVEKDQVLLLMEAMKMENPIRAPQAGK